jgi:hypothetical protein
MKAAHGPLQRAGDDVSTSKCGEEHSLNPGKAVAPKQQQANVSNLSKHDKADLTTHKQYIA